MMGKFGMLNIWPAAAALRRLMHMHQIDLEQLAQERWVVECGARRYVPPAVYLPDQINRIRKTAFASLESTVTTLRGDFEVTDPDTLGYRIRDVDLADGRLYLRSTYKTLQPKSSFRLALRRQESLEKAAIYETWNGNSWFGMWLFGDTLTYMLADLFAPTVTTLLTPSGHVPEYEHLIGMSPYRTQSCHFDELYLFQDDSTNPGKIARAREMRRRLLDKVHISNIPGVFLLRGKTGSSRILENEREIAERLAAQHGFHILDPSYSSVDEIARVCAGARVIAGVEGSHLVHGLVFLPEHGTLFVIQPPERVVGWLKLNADCLERKYAFVVGEAGVEGFRVSMEDIEATLGLIGF